MQEATESSRVMRGAVESSYEYIPEQQPEYIGRRRRILHGMVQVIILRNADISRS